MKTTIAIVRLVLRTNKVLSTGLHPIMLRCSYHGMKEISTGYSCSVRYWDKKNECIKKGFGSYIVINHELKKLKDNAISRRDRFIASGEVYTPSMVLDRSERFESVRNDLRWLIQHYIDEKGLESRTIEKWWIVYRSLIRFASRDLIINEINESFCRRYCKWLEGNGLSSGSIRSYMGKVVALLHYSVDKLKLLDEYPLSGWKYHKDYRDSKSELYIHHRSMDVLIDILLYKLIIRDGELWSYKDGVIEELMDIHSSLYALYLYIVTYYIGGIAPVDISMLKKSDIKVIEIKGESCYAIDGNRSKTNMPYKIRLRVSNLLSGVLIRTMLMFCPGEYFLPTLNGYIGKDIRKRINNVYSYHGEHLVEWFKRCNEEIVRRNVENNDNIPLIDTSCRYYSARHSYIMKEIQSGNVNLLRIATITGKSVQTLHQYITLLSELDLVE